MWKNKIKQNPQYVKYFSPDLSTHSDQCTLLQLADK